MREIDVTADALVNELLRISKTEPVCVLDSCGVGHLGSHLLIAGVRPTETIELTSGDYEDVLRILDEKLSGTSAAIFTLSYDFGARIQQIRQAGENIEPKVSLAVFEALIIHDYDTRRTFLAGDETRLDDFRPAATDAPVEGTPRAGFGTYRPNLSRQEYISAVEKIRELIRRGDTYQTNLTQQLTAKAKTTPDKIFRRLRTDHPAPFAAYIRRRTSTVVSASPERFFCVKRDGTIEASPIKGTRRRGTSLDEDARLRAELLASEKDRAENTMIVDLVRNDLGRVCQYGSVKVEKLCDVEEHPTLFHLVSTVRGELRPRTKFSDILRATFPCGSITGAPKIRTMQIIEEIEPSKRGLSMGAIGVYIPETWDLSGIEYDAIYDLSVAIRTMVIRHGVATFNVGGGIVIDSVPSDEYEESLLKARALLASLGEIPST